MRKRIHFLIVLLLISLFLNLVLALSYHDALQDERQLIDELCGSITLSSISASSRLDEALESSDRRLILMAGIKIEQLSGILESSVSKELGVQNTYGPGSLASLAELIIWAILLTAFPLWDLPTITLHSLQTKLRLSKIYLLLSKNWLYLFMMNL